MAHGNLLVVSAPSGAGKTTVCRRALATLERLSFSVSHTTRPPRAGEENGRDYFFVDREVFERMVAAGEFLEWADVHGNLYGTAKASVFARLEAGEDVLLDIDVQGARQVREACAETVTLFILPPSLEVLESRLRGRGSETEEIIALRLANARTELAQADAYDFAVVNDDLATAVEQFKAIVVALRCRTGRVLSDPHLRSVLGIA